VSREKHLFRPISKGAFHMKSAELVCYSDHSAHMKTSFAEALCTVSQVRAEFLLLDLCLPAVRSQQGTEDTPEAEYRKLQLVLQFIKKKRNSKLRQIYFPV
jgi:hypothetical protein